MSFATMFSLLLGERINLKERLIMQGYEFLSTSRTCKISKYVLIFTFQLKE
jgi:trk system potassium uptake protein TrkH